MTKTKIPEREAIKRPYSSLKWDRKVDNMSDKQVMAVYNRMKANGKL